MQDFYTANFGMPFNSPTVWQQTTGEYNRIDPRVLQDTMTESQRCRVERIRQGRMIYQGLHRDYYLGERRTQNNFPVSEVNGKDIQLYVPFNVLRLISRKHADLLFGQEPIIKNDDESRQLQLRQFSERTQLHPRLYSAAVSSSWAAEAFLETVLIGGLAFTQPIKADEIHPLGERAPDGQFSQYLRQRVYNFGTAKEPMWGLIEETYSPGRIDRNAFALSRSGKKTGALDVTKWPVAHGMPPLSPVTSTGISRNTITYFSNDDDEGDVVSDYDGGLIVLQDMLNSKQTQIARVLAKHSDPKLALPNNYDETEGQVASSQNVFFYNNRDEIPSYIVWNAEIESALKDRTQTLDALCVTAEMAKVLLGLKEGAAPDAARKLRLEATNPLAKAQRKAAIFRPSVRRVLSVAMELEANLAYVGRDPAGQTIVVSAGRSSLVGNIDDVGVEMRDGLPIDELDEAMIVQTYRSSGTMSVRNGIDRRMPDRSTADQEYRDVMAERRADAPSIVLGEPNELPTDEPGADALGDLNAA